MDKTKIPVYDLCSLAKSSTGKSELLVERFGDYLSRHTASLALPHRHSFYHLVLFTKGAGFHTIDFAQYKVTPFEMYFMVPGQVHSWQFQGQTDGYIVNFSENFFRSFLSNPNYLEQFSFFSGNNEDGVLRLPGTVQEKAIDLFDALLSVSTAERSLHGDMSRLLLLQIFLMIDQCVKGKRGNNIPGQKQVVLRNFRRLIDQHFLAIKLPKEYADLLYVTPNHLNALCQDLLGKTAGEMIRDRVLLEAKRLLTTADLTVTEIAYELNFQDNSYFNRFFKKYVGVTPEAFRKQLHQLPT